MPKGDIVLIPFPFTDFTGNKLRPALVLAETNLDLTVVFITTQLQWKEPLDITISPDGTNGIKKPSLIRLSKIAAIDKALVIGKIGSVDQTTLTELNLKLKALFQIP